MDKKNIDHLAREQKLIETSKIGIEGMTCDKCVQTIERAFREVDGVREVKVDRASAIATVSYDSSKTDVPALHETLLRSGYKPTPSFE